MAIHRLTIDEFEDDDFTLIALHTSLEDYQLAFFINRNFHVLLHRIEDIPMTSREGDAFFSRFSWEDEEHGESWDMIENKSEVTDARLAAGDLFQTEVTSVLHLLPEYRKVDYFLKIQNTSERTEKILSGLNNIEKVSAVYEVDASRIKSRNNLIF